MSEYTDAANKTHRVMQRTLPCDDSELHQRLIEELHRIFSKNNTA